MVIPIYLPPLRERTEDIPLLVETFVRQFTREMGQEVRRVSPETMDLLMDYQWKGNIRELKNILERTVILGDGDPITPEHLPDEIRYLDRPATIPDSGHSNEIRPLQDMIIDYIQKTLVATGGNKSEAARLLGITRQRLKRILRNSATGPP